MLKDAEKSTYLVVIDSNREQGTGRNPPRLWEQRAQYSGRTRVSRVIDRQPKRPETQSDYSQSERRYIACFCA